MNPALLIMDQTEAAAAGFKIAAGPYHRVHEMWMLENAWKGFAGCEVRVVETWQGLEIWRHERELVDDESPVMVPELANVKTGRGCITKGRNH